MSRWCALAALLAALHSPPARADDDGVAHRERAAALRDAQMYAQSLDEWKRAYAIRQEPRLLYEMACLYQKLNHPKEASELFRRYLVAEPSLDEGTRGEVEARLHLIAGPPPPAPAAELEALPDGTRLVSVHYQTRPRRGLLAGGSVLLALGYVPSSIVGALFLACCSKGSDSISGPSSSGPLLLPVVGPFISALVVREAVWSLPWILDGIAQVAGLAMIISAVRNPEKVPIFSERLTLVPFADPRGAGLSAFGIF